MRQLGISIIMHCEDCDEMYPTIGLFSAATPWDCQISLQPYCKNKKIWHCPSLSPDTGGYPGVPASEFASYRPSANVCYFTGWEMDLGYSCDGLGLGGDPYYAVKPCLSLGTVKGPSNLVVMLEGNSAPYGAGGAWYGWVIDLYVNVIGYTVCRIRSELGMAIQDLTSAEQLAYLA